MQHGGVDADDEPSLQQAHALFDRTGHEQLKLLEADGYDARDASCSLFDRLLTAEPEDHPPMERRMERLEPVMQSTGFTADQAERTLLLWEEIARLRGEGLGTVDIVQQLTKRLKSGPAAGRGRRHLGEAGQNATESTFASCVKKHKYGWTEAESAPSAGGSGAAILKRKRLQ
mmetsp:Transcript_22971/g.59074  ORF Transcript_22971/g.59074 Transcript_22971/m.59074 type:complete len:173 (-) Transcript_22971:483-1001(-)